MSEAITGLAEDSGVASKRRARLWIIAGIALCVAIGWALMLVMVRGHAVGVEGFAVLGPGMEILQIFGVAELPDGLWGDICRAFIVGGGTQSTSWLWQEALLALLMWQVMALAMMLPTAAPFIATYGDISRAARDKDMDQPSVAVFVVGYLMVWGALAIVATGVQWVISAGSTDSPVLINSAPLVGGVMLVLAGAYQWSVIKEACLSQCRSPMRFFMTYWRDGTSGALQMGMRHGLYCAGCCWALMALMFVGGTMNLIWMAVLTVIMLLERVLPRGEAFGRFAGGVLVIWGLMLLVVGFNNYL